MISNPQSDMWKVKIRPQFFPLRKDKALKAIRPSCESKTGWALLRLRRRGQSIASLQLNERSPALNVFRIPSIRDWAQHTLEQCSARTRWVTERIASSSREAPQSSERNNRFESI